MELVDGSNKTHTTGTTSDQSADSGNVNTQYEADGRIDSVGQESVVKKPQQAVKTHAPDHIDLESGLPHPGIRIDSASTPLASDDNSDVKIGAMREPIVPRPPRVFQHSIGEELDSNKGLPHPGVRIPTPGVREDQKEQYIADMPSPRIEQMESVLTPWPEEQQFSPWGYDAELTNMNSTHSGSGQSRSP